MTVCRHCTRPVREVQAPTGNYWVHTDNDEFPCRDSDGNITTLDAAEPAKGYPLDALAAARDAYEGRFALMEEAREERDSLIREAIRQKVSPQEIADASGLKIARIYQIRDGRR